MNIFRKNVLRAACAFFLSTAFGQHMQQRLAVGAAGTIIGESTSKKSSQVDQVVIAFKTHFDIGYTDTAVNVIHRYRTTMIDEALKVCDRNRDLLSEQQFVWTIPGWPMKKILEDWEEQTPERRRRILQAYRQGRFVTHALPFTTHTELLELEDLVRGMGFSSQLSQLVHLPLSRDAKMTDVPCHTWVMPTLLKHAGVDFFHIGCNAGSRSPEVPRLFWWEGPDGSRLLTMYIAESYGTGLIPPKDWPYRTWLALIHTGDNHGPPRPEEVKHLLRQAKEKLPWAKVRIGRLSDFADAILSENPDLPIVRGDMPDTWIHGPMCDPAGAKIARNIRPAIAATESLNSLLRAWAVKVPDIAPTIADAYENSLLYSEHTWGGALYWVTSYSRDRKFNYGQAWKNERAQGRFKKLEASWDEHTAYIERTRDLIGPALDGNLRTLAEAVDVEGKRIIVYNPLPWKRDGVVSVQTAGAVITVLKPADGHETLPVEAKGNVLRFVARDVPPMGYRTYVPVDARSRELKVNQHTRVIESPFFKVALDPARGIIASLIDKRSGRELVDTHAQHGFGQYLYEHFDAGQVEEFVKAYVKIDADWAINELGKPAMPAADQVPYRAISPNDFTLHFEQTLFSLKAAMEAAACPELPHGVTTKVTVYNDLPYLDVEIVLRKKTADPWPEAGWICLPVNVERPRFHLMRLGSIIDPSRDVVRGANRHLFALNGGLSITDSRGYGVGLCPVDHPLVSLEKSGCWKYSMDFVPQKSRVYVNLFNNQWTTNFRLWNEGTWASRVRIWAIHRYDPDMSLVTPSQEVRFPLLAAYFDGHGGKLPVLQQGLALSRKGVVVTALGSNHDGDGTLLRLWELSGKSGICRITLPEGLEVNVVQPVDLRGQPQGKPIPVRNRTFAIDLPSFAPASFLLEW